MLLYVRLYHPNRPPAQDPQGSRLDFASFTLSDEIRKDTLADYRRMTASNYDLHSVNVDDTLIHPIFAKGTLFLAITYSICMLIWALIIRSNLNAESFNVDLIGLFFASFLTSIGAAVFIFSRFIGRHLNKLALKKGEEFASDYRREDELEENPNTITINIDPPIPWRPAASPPIVSTRSVKAKRKKVVQIKEDEDLERFDFL